MKKYIDAELQIVRLSNNVIATSTIGRSEDAVNNVGGGAADRFGDWED